jgi:phosphatidylglycerophosphate synthase
VIPNYSYSSSVKSERSDELINTYVMRPLAGLLVRLLYPTPVTPNQVTIASTVIGCVAACLYLAAQPAWTLAAGLFISLKDLLDSADGQLARAKGMYSRFGRFLDSIGDFIVNLAVFSAIGAVLVQETGNPRIVLLAFLGFLGISLRVSYHVFYQSSYLHLHESYTTNRTTEEVREEDRHANRRVLFMQRLFQVLYGWQDRLVMRLDNWCGRAGLTEEDQLHRWYADPLGLRLSGLLGIGTELFQLMLFSLAGRLDLYLWWNAVALNGLWFATMVYRRRVLYPILREKQ